MTAGHHASYWVLTDWVSLCPYISLCPSLSLSRSQYTITRGSRLVDVCITPVGVWKKEPSCSCEQNSDSIALPPQRITDVETMIWRMNGATFIRCSFIHLLDSLIWSQISCAPSFNTAGNWRNVWTRITDLKHYMDLTQRQRQRFPDPDVMNDYDYSAVSFFNFRFPPLRTHSASPRSLSHTLSDWVALKYLIIVDGNWHHWICFPVMVELLWTNYTRETVAAISTSPHFRIWASESKFSNIVYLNCENVTVLKWFWQIRGEQGAFYTEKQLD